MNNNIKLAIIGIIAIGLGTSYGISNANSPNKEGPPANANAGKIQAQAVPAPESAPQGPKAPEPETLELTEKSTVIFRGEVNTLSVAKAQKELSDKSRKLSKNATIYLVLDTPGGDIPTGMQLVDTIKGLPQRVKTITIFAASMGFYIAQALDERLIMPSGTLMAHRARVGGVAGEIPGNFLVRVNNLLDMVTKMEKNNASRLGVDLAKYRESTRDEYWVIGEDAVKQGSADKQTYLKCDASLDGTYTETVNFGFFPVNLTYSKCPAITGILGFSLGKDKASAESLDQLGLYINNKAEYVRRYIVPKTVF